MTNSVPQQEDDPSVIKLRAAVHEAGHTCGFENPEIRARIDNASIKPDDVARTSGHVNWTPEVDPDDNAVVRARLVMVLAGPTASRVVLGWDEQLRANDKGLAEFYALQLAKNGSSVCSGRQTQALQNQTQQSMNAQQIDAVSFSEPLPQPAQVEKELTKAWAAARALIEEKLSSVNAVVAALLAHEELSGDEIRAIYETGSLPAPRP